METKQKQHERFPEHKQTCLLPLSVRMPFGQRSRGAAGTSLSELVPNCEGAVSQTRRNEVSFSPGQGLGATEFPSWRSEDITSNC